MKQNGGNVSGGNYSGNICGEMKHWRFLQPEDPENVPVFFNIPGTTRLRGFFVLLESDVREKRHRFVHCLCLGGGLPGALGDSGYRQGGIQLGRLEPLLRAECRCLLACNHLQFTKLQPAA